MKKHLGVKAVVLLLVMFFHSFVLVPRANATTWEGVAGRLAFRAMAPAAIAALGSGTALVIGCVVAGGVGYLIYKSGAVTALETWLESIGAGYSNPAYGTTGFYYTAPDATVWTITVIWASNTWKSYAYKPPGSYINNGGLYYSGTGSTDSEKYYSSLALLKAAIDAGHPGGGYGHWGTGSPAYPGDAMDYGSSLALTQPSFPVNSVYATPGTAAAVLGTAAIVSATTMSDSDADRFIAGLGATPVDSSGTQAGSPPATTDNTVTAGDTASIGLLQQILNFVSNLVGIKTAVDAQRVALDNVVAISNSQTGRLDNILVATNAQTAVLDNVGVAIQEQTAYLQDIATKVEHLDNTITGSTATEATVQSRIESLKTAASTKFPFSLAGSLSVSAPADSGAYDFGSLPLTPSISIPIQPMAGPLSTLFTWIRTLLVWFFWAGTLLAILRKGMEM